MSANASFPDRGPSVLAVTTATLVVASVFVSARLVSRCAIVRHVTLDDYFIILGWFIAFGLSFSIDYGTSKGLGRHDANIEESWFPSLRRSEYAFSVLYNPALMATKTSILIFYLRLSRNTNKLLRIASYLTLAVVNIAGVVLTFLNVFQCRPVSSAFNPSITPDQCISLVTLYLASSPVNVITDLAILVLPLPVLTRMNLPQKQKTILIFTFTLGIFVAVVDVVRIYYLQKAQVEVPDGSIAEPSTGIGDETDFAWYASLSLMWTAVEVNIGIICACIPTLKPLISRIIPKLIDHVHGSNEKNSTLASHVGADSEIQPHGSTSMSIDTPPAIQPLPSVHQGGNQEHEMGMMDFLTMPGMEPEQIKRTHTTRTQATDNTVYFGFINMRRPKSMLKTDARESLKYCTLVTVLFFLWGFSYGLLNTLNSEIALIAGINTSQTLGLQSAYFGAYLIAPLTIGQYVLKKGGFKATFIMGLCVYGTGTLMFWPSAVLTSFPGFIVSNFVVASGLSILETAANPFLALCGPQDYGEMRLLIAQGVQGVGSVVSPILAEKVLFKSISNGNDSLIDVQWAYLAIAFFDVILALIFYYMPLPEASDEDLDAQGQEDELPQLNHTISNPTPVHAHMGKYRVVYITLVLGVMAQFFYVSGQECMSVWLGVLINSASVATNSTLGLSLSNYSSVAHTAFTISRFLGALLCLIMKPRILLLLTVTGVLVFTILVFALNNASANTIAGLIIAILFFEGPIFPIIFAIALRGVGRSTKSAAAWLTAAVGGGAIFPWAMYAVQVSAGQSPRYSCCVVLALAAATLVFPVYMCLSPAAREQVDPGKPKRHVQRMSRIVGTIAHMFKDSSEMRRNSGAPSVQHMEGENMPVSHDLER